MTQRITRRRLLLTAMGAVAGLGAIACSQPSAPPAAKPADAPKPAAPAATAAPAAAGKPAEAAKPAAAAPAVATSAPKPASTTPAGKLTVAMSPEPGSLRFSGGNGGGANMSVFNLHETLIDVDVDEKKIPGLATSWKVVNNGMGYEFELRKGVKFHNGYPFTANDVKMSMEKWQEPETPNRLNYTMVDRIEVLDDYKFIMHLNKLFPAMLGTMAAQFFVGSAKYQDEVGHEGNDRLPISLGPYKFVKREINEYVELEAYEEHPYRVPSVKNLMLRIVPEDQTKLALLQTGEVDIAHNLSPLAVKQLQGIPGIQIAKAGLGSALTIALDSKRAPEGHPLKDLRVRQALNYAVDKQAIVDKLLFGQATAVGSAQTPGCMGYDATAIPPYPYDPAKAKQLLAAAGYPDGFEMKMFGVIGRFPAGTETVEAVATYLQAVGVKSAVSHLEYGDWVASRRVQDNLRLFPAHFYSISPKAGEMTTDLYDSFYSKELRSTYANPELDKLLDETAKIVDDGERAAGLTKVFKFLHDDAAALFLFEPQALAGYGPRVEHWEMVKTRVYGEYWNAKLKA